MNRLSARLAGELRAIAFAVTQLATMARAMVARTTSVLTDCVPADPRNLPDVTTDHWAYSYVEYCVEHGVVGGYPDGSYRPDVVVTRDQMAVYVARAFELGM